MKVFIGYDNREVRAYNVCKFSIQRHASEPVDFQPLMHVPLRKMGYFHRPWDEKNGIMYDRKDGKPFSTEFAFTRFLVPAIQQWKGWALFMDCDMLVRGDIGEVFRLRDPKYAVMCVKHKYEPTEQTKMDGAPQEIYFRKNWSSFVLWNCEHPSNRQVTSNMVNSATGAFLHGFKWLEDDEIGELPERWNWLEGHSSRRIKPKNIHYTRGGPWFPNWQDVQYAEDWRAEERMMRSRKPTEWQGLEAV